MGWCRAVTTTLKKQYTNGFVRVFVWMCVGVHGDFTQPSKLNRSKDQWIWFTTDNNLCTCTYPHNNSLLLYQTLTRVTIKLIECEMLILIHMIPCFHFDIICLDSLFKTKYMFIIDAWNYVMLRLFVVKLFDDDKS